MVHALAFFFLGLPVALAADYLVRRFTRDDEEPEADDVPLPWQRGVWPGRLRLAIVALLPLLMALAGEQFDTGQALAVSALLAALVICTATDLLQYRVPNAITYPGTGLALAAALLMPDSDLEGALVAAALGGGLFFVLALASRGALGLGDVKLAVLIGAALGMPHGYQALFFGIVLAGLVLLVLYVCGFVNRRQSVPYAPFLTIAAVAVVLLQGASFAPL